MADITPLIEPSIHFEYGEQALDWLRDSKKTTNIITHKKIKNRKIRRTIKFQVISDLKRERIIEVLNYLVDYGIPLVNYDITAEKIGLPVNTFSEIFQFLIDTKVIALAHRFKSIGAGREYAFIFENTTPEINDFIKQKLLQCVFSYFYEGKTMLAGRLQVPDAWVASLMEFFTRMQFRYPKLVMSYGQRLLGYSLFVPNVKLPPNYILDEFGMKQILTNQN